MTQELYPLPVAFADKAYVPERCSGNAVPREPYFVSKTVLPFIVMIFPPAEMFCQPE